MQTDEKTIGDTTQETDFSKTDLNSITYEQLIEFGLDRTAANHMLRTRTDIGGFMNREQILDIDEIDADLTEDLIAVCPLNTSKIPRYTLMNAPEKWLKNHDYFFSSADIIIHYRKFIRDEKKIWKILNLKPKDEAKMKLYLK